MKTFAALLVACVFGATCACAHEYSLDSLRIDHPFARATPPGAKAGGVFVTVQNNGSRSDRLLRVSTPMAGVAELHGMSVDGGVMRMRGVTALDVAPGVVDQVLEPPVVQVRRGQRHDVPPSSAAACAGIT